MSDMISVRAVDQANAISSFYLHLTGPDRLPLVLGTGRNAVVFLATTTSDPENEAAEYRAIKFLRDDIDKQYALTAAYRFFDEAENAKRFHRLQVNFVTYFGWGAIDTPPPDDETSPLQQFWWLDQLASVKGRINDGAGENADELKRLLRHYDLQGPFYVLDLCQGTLYDMLDKSMPWFQLPAYTISTYHDSLSSQSKIVAAMIEQVTTAYLTRSPAGRSGYDILNSFKNEPSANQLRSRAVLQIFSQITDAVSKLHKKRSESELGGRGSRMKPLAHRDLKPGNIFFQHDASIDGLNLITLQLSDLGYVTDALQISTGGMTLRTGKKGAEYQAPGSQFYRAPEQSELPVEVRVDIDPQQPSRVRVRGSKIESVDVHDWLLLSDIFTDAERNSDLSIGLFKIQQVKLGEDEHGEFYDLLLDKQIITTRTEDVQGQIIRATGFQTDGFSLGAILYDMISGGKNPQKFYIYCILSLTGSSASFDRSKQAERLTKVDQIMKVLAPVERSDRKANEAINWAERRLMLRALIEAGDLDDLFERLQNIAFNAVSYRKQTELTFQQRLRLVNDVVRGKEIKDLDDLVIELIRSPRFIPSETADGHESGNHKETFDMVERLRNYQFRKFHQVDDLLRDKRGVLIPRDILQVIVACMVRDMEGSYYTRDPKDGYNSDASFATATTIHQDVVQLLSKEEYQLPKNSGFPELLAENLLFKLRSLARDSQPMSSDVPETVSQV